MNLFIKKNDKIEVEVFVYEKDGQIESTTEKTEIPSEITTAQSLKFIFRKPTYADSKSIISLSSKGNSILEIDPLLLQNNVLRTLLAEWDLQEDGKPIECNIKNLDRLSPSIALAAASGILQKIKIS